MRNWKLKRVSFELERQRRQRESEARDRLEQAAMARKKRAEEETRKKKAQEFRPLYRLQLQKPEQARKKKAEEKPEEAVVRSRQPQKKRWWAVRRRKRNIKRRLLQHVAHFARHMYTKCTYVHSPLWDWFQLSNRSLQPIRIGCSYRTGLGPKLGFEEQMSVQKC